jgi:hypothetical protein
MISDEQQVELLALRDSVRLYSKALEESIKLQSHYAGILNMYDGGERLQFKDVFEWIQRLRTNNIL